MPCVPHWAKLERAFAVENTLDFALCSVADTGGNTKKRALVVDGADLCEDDKITLLWVF